MTAFGSYFERAYVINLPERADLTYFVTHPCHPPLFNDETDPAAKRDFFGGVAAFVAGSVMSAAAPSFALLLIARVLQGFGAGAMRVVTVGPEARS